MIYKKENEFLIEKMPDGFEIPDGQENDFYESDVELNLIISYLDITSYKYKVSEIGLQENSFSTVWAFYNGSPTRVVKEALKSLPNEYDTMTDLQIQDHLFSLSKKEAIEKLNARCRAIIYAGLDHDGKVFDSTENDQLNLTALYVAIQNGIITESCKLQYTDENGTVRHENFTLEQITNVALAMLGFVKSKLDYYRGLKNEVRNSTDITQVSPILDKMEAI